MLLCDSATREEAWNVSEHLGTSVAKRENLPSAFLSHEAPRIRDIGDIREKTVGIYRKIDVPIYRDFCPINPRDRFARIIISADTIMQMK